MLVIRSLCSAKNLGFGLVIGGLLAVGCGGTQPGTAGPDLERAKKVSPAGAQVYASECSGCHGSKGEGQAATPSVMGDTALPKEAGGRAPIRTAADLFDYVKTNMPLPKARAGTLSEDQYWAVTTFLVVANGKMTPQQGLNAENAQGVVINP